MKIKQSMILFIHTQKQKQLSMKVTLIICLNQSILQLYQRYKNSGLNLGKGSGWIIDSVINHNLSISKYNPLAGSSYRLINIQKD